MNLTELKALRLKKGLKQKDIAQILGINTNSYTKKENKKNPFTLAEAKILKEYFELDNNLFIKIFF